METVNAFYIRYKSLPTYEEFYNDVMTKNILCVFPAELTSTWECRKDWITPGNGVNFRHLEESYGEMECPVYKCNEQYFNSNPSKTIKLKEYLEYWRRMVQLEHRFEQNEEDILYLKDWHLFSDSGDDQKVFTLPVYFEADYLNDYCVAKGLTDYKFVYLGPKGSR